METLIKKTRFPMKHLFSIGILPSVLKVPLYRLKGYKIGKGVKIGIGSVVIGKEVEIGDNSKIGFFTVIKAKTIKIGRFVSIGATTFIDTGRFEIGDDSRINEQVFVGGIKTPASALVLGKRTVIMQMSFINPTLPITVGDDSGIGGHCLLFTHGSWLNELEGFPVTFAPITLGKKVWLPWRVFIMPGVTVGDNVVIGANSLVNRDLPSNSLAAGSPAKLLKENVFKPLDEASKQEMMNKYILDFIAYVNYFNVKASLKENTASVVSIELESKGKISRIDWVKDAKWKPVGISGTSDRTLIVEHMDLHPDLKTNYNMILTLSDYKRKGTAKGGEELVSFISRYGVRFDRLD